MPRKARMYLPDVPSHVVQRGHNRGPCFMSNNDFRIYLRCLEKAAHRFNVAIHAYVLMTNHVHLLMTPRDADSISRVMQCTNGKYGIYFNKCYGRTGGLWEDRHKSSLVQTDAYLLVCSRYIELNPVRARMVSHPADYEWSSFRRNAYGADDPLVSEHEIYSALGSDGAQRRSAYLSLFPDQLVAQEIGSIRRALNYSIPLGNDRFRRQIEASLGRRTGQAHRGRPRRPKWGPADENASH